MTETVVAVVGPTAVGKTDLSIEIAKKFQGEIISGDSMQVYRGMDIGTAKIKPQEMQGIPHAMIDIKYPNESFTVVDFQSCVQDHISEITKRNKLPILVGGSGLYIQSALYDYNFSSSNRNEKFTKELEAEIKQHGIEPIYNRLVQIDPIQAKKIHPNNHRRVIRALEIYETTGLTMSEYQKKQATESPYNIIFLGLEMDRGILYERINRRVDNMMEEGLLGEVIQLTSQYSSQIESMQAIGYKEFIPYINGEYSLEEAVRLLKRNSRRYAKRQYTWFKNKLDGVNWYNITPDHKNLTFEKILIDLEGLL